MTWKLRTTRIWTLLLLACALLLISPGVASAQSNNDGPKMLGLKFDTGNIDSKLDEKLRQGVSDVLADTPLRFVDFETVRESIEPVTKDCFSQDCLQNIATKMDAPLGLRVEMTGENEIYVWTIETWDLKAGKRIDSTKTTCELCGESEVTQSFSASLEKMLNNGPPQNGAGAQAIGEGQVVLQVSVVPSGAEILLDGEVAGKGDVTVGVEPGEHDVHIRMDGYRDIKEHILVNDQTTGPILFRYHLTNTDAEVVQVPPTVGPIDRLGENGRLIVGLAGVGVGTLALGTGIYLTAIDGDPSCSDGVPVTACPDVYATGGGGLVLGALGGALMAGGVTLLSWEVLAGSPSDADTAVPDSPASDAPAEGASVSVGPAVGSDGGGFVLSGSF